MELRCPESQPNVLMTNEKLQGESEEKLLLKMTPKMGPFQTLVTSKQFDPFLDLSQNWFLVSQSTVGRTNPLADQKTLPLPPL